jgi:hypothetical protein
MTDITKCDNQECEYRLIEVEPNAKVSGAGTASAGLPGYTAGGDTE